MLCVRVCVCVCVCVRVACLCACACACACACVCVCACSVNGQAENQGVREKSKLLLDADVKRDHSAFQVALGHHERDSGCRR